MEEPSEHIAEALPIASTSKEIESSEVENVHPWKVGILLVGATLLGVIILMGMSFKALGNLEGYHGTLSPYLPIRSGEIEYSRLPEEYWEHRIRMIKAMGLNAVSIYVMWNHHELKQGSFDFVNGNKNLTAFLELTKEYELNVLLRPGPYVCAEWDFGGLPARLLGIEGLEIRSANALYETEVKLYFRALAPIIRPYLAANGGNIILLQIQNQFGYFGSDNQHILNLVQMWKELNVKCEYYLEDPAAHWKISYWPGAHLGLSQTSFLLRYVDIELSPLREDTLLFGGEVYSGWFTEWGFDWGGVANDLISKSVQAMVDYNRSFSLYMVYGGTNFGVTAGANGFNGYFEYLPHLTSYDYDAPISEQGRATPKYLSLRSILEQEKVEHLPEIPDPLPSISIQQFKPTLQACLWSNLPKPALVDSDLTFFQSPKLEMYNQGIVIYQTLLPLAKTYKFKITYHDFAMIFVDDRAVINMMRRTREIETFTVSCEDDRGCKLKVLIEAMGHINFGHDQATDRKGLIVFEELGSDAVYKWTIYKIPVHDSAILGWDNTASSLTFPAIYKAELNLASVGDTYLDMSAYKKGYIYVNGHLLGRYWDLGPQKRVFCPGVWLNNGTNVVTVFELLEGGAQNIRGFDTLKE